MADQRLVAAALVVGGIAIGWVVRAQLDLSSARAAPSQGAPQATSKPVPSSSTAMQEAFEDIYKNATWGKNDAKVGNSGTGSTLQSTLIYRTFLQEFLKKNNIHSVVDAGCGDWEFSQAIDWTGIDYKGFDIVPAIVEADKKKFEKANVHFFQANIIETDLPPADLLISKHVLQHLPTADVQKFLRQLSRYKHVLLTNGTDPTTFTAENTDISPGDYRHLDVTAPPFNLRQGFKVLNYFDSDYMHQVVHLVPKK